MLTRYYLTLMFKRLLYAVALVVAVALVMIPDAAMTNSGGAPALRTGAPGESTCASSFCHDSFGLNTGSGSVEILLPNNYSSGEVIEVQVKVAEEGARRFGFEVTAKDAAGSDAGTFTLSNSEIRFASGQAGYITHSPAARVNNEKTWMVQWTAPDVSTGDITFYATGNAADGNGSRSGDQIYSTSVMMSPASGVTVEDELVHTSFALEAAYPNPFITHTTIPFELKEAAPVTLRVYDMNGKVVQDRELGVRVAGAHEVAVEAEGLASGLYIYELITPRGRQSRSFHIVK